MARGKPGVPRQKKDKDEKTSEAHKLSHATNPNRKRGAEAMALHRANRSNRANNRWGVPDGMTREQAAPIWEASRQRAKEDMAKLQEAGVINPDDTNANEAMQNALEVMRSPMNQDMRLKAAKLVLEYTKAKPVSKSEVTVNAAEAWLASLIDGDKDGNK